MDAKVLIIDDDARITRMLGRVLRPDEFRVHAALDGSHGVQLARKVLPDLIILDIMLPGADGFTVCQRLRRVTGTPILMLTALSAPDQCVRGLDAGADDYLGKPFDIDVLLARVRALLRRARAHTGSLAEPPVVLSYAEVSLDTGSRRVGRGGRTVELTALEFKLLRLFLVHPEQILTREHLLAQAWGPDFDCASNVLAVQVCSLRDKLEQDGGYRLIHTVRGSGYILRQ